MPTDLHTLTEQVQHNCHISDARHARNYSLCIYLLKMREFFRWEMGYRYSDRLPEKQLGEWLTERERMWEDVEGSDYVPIVVDDTSLTPFEVSPINEQLLRQGLVYSGGYGGLSKPHFFLADLHAQQERHDHRILVAGKEYARDITAPPAMTLEKTVFVRLESLRRMLWEKIEEWNWRRQENAMARTLRHYDISGNLEGSLDAMTEVESEAVILHELGEIEAGLLLGPRWEMMLNALWHTRAEHVARAVRDHLADCLVTLPTLLAEQREASLHFYFANLSGMRQAIFPSLQQAYLHWVEDGNPGGLFEAVKRGAEHWEKSAVRLLVAWGGEDNGAAERLGEVGNLEL